MKPEPGPVWAVTPQGWGAVYNYDAMTDQLGQQEGIAIHHGGGGDYPAHRPPYTLDKEAAQLRGWERYHLSKGWRGIAYNWAVGMTGNVYRLRGWNLNGAHLGDLDDDGVSNQREILAVLFVMSGDIVPPSAQMLAGFERLRNYIETHTGPLRLYGHKEVQPAQPTSCPGRFNMPYVVTHRDSVVRVKPSDAVVDWLFDSGLAQGDREYWKQLPAESAEWARFTEVAQGGFVRWAVESGLVQPNEEWTVNYWLRLPAGSAEWQGFWRSVGDGAPDVA